MTKLQEPHTSSVSRANEARLHGRRKLATMAYVELGQDNGGILLNIGEGGLAVQSALTLTSKDFPEIRFQLPRFRRWFTVSGRLAWISESRTEAGIQFVDMPEAVRTQITNWISSETSELQEGTNGDAHETDRGSRKQHVGAGQSKTALGVGMPNGSAPAGNGQEEIIVEAAPQTFRFPDYSMFATDGHAENVWMEPKPRRSWGRIALLVIFLAAFFFALGASMGYGGLRQWVNQGLAYVGVEKQNGSAAPVANEGAGGSTTPSVPGDRDAQQPNTPPQPGGEQQGTGDPLVSEQQSDGQQLNGQKANAQTQAAEGTRQDEGEQASEDGSPARNAAPETETKATAKDSVRGSGKEKPMRQTGRRTAGLGAASGYGIEREVSDPSQHSILVSAPEPGSPAFMVNFPGEAVSASTWVAISARRSVRILPRAASGFSRSQRVTIGKLISHSDPFYPLEARNKRIEGSVELRATVGRAGGIISIVPIRGPDLLTAAGMAALREWRYEPTFIDGDPVETQADVMMVFRLP